MKIKRIVFLILLIFSLVPLHIFGFFMVYENNRKVEQVLRENLAAISGTQILDISNFCRTRKEKLEIISRMDLVHDAVRQGGNGDIRYLTNMLVEWRHNSPYLESLSVIDKDFQVIASSEFFTLTGKSELGKMDDRYLSGEFCISNVLERVENGKPKRTLAAILGIFEEGQLIGYVVEEINPNYFEQNWSETNLSAKGTLYLIDGNETLITAGTPGEASREGYVTSADEREDYARAWNAIDHEANPAGEFSYNVGNVKYITYYSDLPYSDWTIRITVNLSAYQSSKNAYRMLLALSILVISLMTIVASHTLSKRFTRVIDHIADTLKRIQKGQDFTLRIENDSQDELGVLSAKINLLLDYIEQENLQEKEAQRRLAIKSELDPLTGVKNKTAIEEYVLDVVRRMEEDGRQITVAFVDIDDFKNYNTRYGHLEGDRVLQFVASVLEQHAGGTVGRNGGDEFLFVMEWVEDESAAESAVEAIMEALRTGYPSWETGGMMPIPCSIGVALAKGVGLHYSEIIRAADKAMYEAKQKGKDGWCMIRLQSKTKAP